MPQQLSKTLDYNLGPIYLERRYKGYLCHRNCGRLPWLAGIKNSKKFREVRGRTMWDTCAVELRVHLPKTVAVEVEQVQRTDPEMLSRILYYAMTRRTIYETLAAKAAIDGTKAVLTPQIP